MKMRNYRAFSQVAELDVVNCRVCGTLIYDEGVAVCSGECWAKEQLAKPIDVTDLADWELSIEKQLGESVVNGA